MILSCQQLQQEEKRRLGPKTKPTIQAKMRRVENIFRFLLGKEDEFLSYNPQTKFLKLITLGDEEAFGNKFGISFRGKWVWNLKKHIEAQFFLIKCHKALAQA